MRNSRARANRFLTSIIPFNDLANRNERDENDEISNSRDAFAAKGDVGDFQA